MNLKMEIDLKNEELAKKIFKSLAPDIKKEKEKINLINGKIIFEIEDDNFSHILASCTSILKLINETIKLERNLLERTQK
ncbi:MAG: KEOPS complex subunit Pcc1 [Candidatus Aenigmatarchaeota archaeon]